MGKASEKTRGYWARGGEGSFPAFFVLSVLRAVALFSAPCEGAFTAVKCSARAQYQQINLMAANYREIRNTFSKGQKIK